MRAYPYVQVSLTIVFVIVASVSATLVRPQDATAREPEYEIITDQRTGGSSGGAEWRTPPENPDEMYPLDIEDGKGSGGREYPEPLEGNSSNAWAQSVNSLIVSMVRLVGTTFSELF